jgi:hypothetical protein
MYLNVFVVCFNVFERIQMYVNVFIIYFNVFIVYLDVFKCVYSIFQCISIFISPF